MPLVRYTQLLTLFCTLLVATPLLSLRAKAQGNPSCLRFSANIAEKKHLEEIVNTFPNNSILNVSGGQWPVGGRWLFADKWIDLAFDPYKKDGSQRSFFWNLTMGSSSVMAGHNPLMHPLGDNDIVESFGDGKLGFFKKNISSGQISPMFLIHFENFSNKYGWFYGGEFANLPALQVDAIAEKGSTSSINGIQVNLESLGNNPFSAEDQGLNVLVHKHGQNSTWQISGQTQDDTGLPPDAFASIGAELDILANGPDTPSSMYDPIEGNRTFLWLVPKNNPVPPHAGGHFYMKGAPVAVTLPSGERVVFIAQKAGTTGKFAPSWSKQGVITDGSVVWKYSEPYNVSIAKGIFLDSAKNTAYSTGIVAHAIFQNAVIDLSKAQLAFPSSAALRLRPDMPVDFSALGTKGSQNQHTLAYSGKEGGLNYKVHSKSVLKVSDMGDLSVSGGIKARDLTLSPGISPTATTVCPPGKVIFNDDFLYICTSKQRYKRVALRDIKP